jgi:hypothetical protein
LRDTKVKPTIVEFFLADNAGVLVPFGEPGVKTPKEPSIEDGYLFLRAQLGIPESKKAVQERIIHRRGTIR